MNAITIEAIKAIASQRANDQSKFWNIYKLLYDNQEKENSGGLSVENSRGIALKMPSLNLHEFNFCLNDKKPKAFAENDTNIAFAFSHHGKSTLLVEKLDGSDQELLVRGHPFYSIQVVIDKKISEG